MFEHCDCYKYTFINDKKKHWNEFMTKEARAWLTQLDNNETKMK